MAGALSRPQLERISELIAARLALNFPPERWDDLERRLTLAAREFGFPDPAQFSVWLNHPSLPPRKLGALASQLTISETYFWREPLVFQALEQQVLPEKIRAWRGKSRGLRLWSAGCATGEEAYSLAIALRRTALLEPGQPAMVLATDINPQALRIARAGVYGSWSFRNPPAWLKQDHFLAVRGGKWVVRPEIREMVSFAHLNLAEEAHPVLPGGIQDLDIILCRNVLMYFLPERARAVVKKLHRCLTGGGWLVLGACELSLAKFGHFEAVQFPGAILFRKPNPVLAARPASRQPAEGDESQPSAGLVPVSSGSAAAPPPSPGGPTWSLDSPGAPADEPGPGSAPVAPPGPGTTAEETRGRIRALADSGRLPEALALCEQALSSAKLEPKLHYLHATILLEMEDPEAASVALRRALYLEPALVAAHFTLGNLLLRQDNLAGARKSFGNVLRLLHARAAEEILPEIEGLTAGRLRAIVQATLKTGGLA